MAEDVGGAHHSWLRVKSRDHEQHEHDETPTSSEEDVEQRTKVQPARSASRIEKRVRKNSSQKRESNLENSPPWGQLPLEPYLINHWDEVKDQEPRDRAISLVRKFIAEGFPHEQLVPRYPLISD